MKLIGLQLVPCIKDILSGRVKEEDIIQIRSSAEGPWDVWLKLINWSEDNARAIIIARRLIDQGKVIRPTELGVEQLGVQVGTKDGKHWLDTSGNLVYIE